jgi:primosomal protein N' (replication factor Y) (superfamily II helicase)
MTAGCFHGHSVDLRDWLAAGPKTKGTLKLEVDIDPQSFL